MEQTFGNEIGWFDHLNSKYCPKMMMRKSFFFFFPTAIKDNVENASAKGQKTASNQLEKELWHSLAAYMNSEIPYTIKRLLPADLKVFSFIQNNLEWLL